MLVNAAVKTARSSANPFSGIKSGTVSKGAIRYNNAKTITVLMCFGVSPSSNNAYSINALSISFLDALICLNLCHVLSRGKSDIISPCLVIKL